MVFTTWANELGDSPLLWSEFHFMQCTRVPLLVMLPALASHWLELTTLTAVHAATSGALTGAALLQDAWSSDTRVGATSSQDEELSGAEDQISSAEASGSLVTAEAPWRAFLGTASLVFVAEWGDRSMLATIALGAAQSPVGAPDSLLPRRVGERYLSHVARAGLSINARVLCGM